MLALDKEQHFEPQWNLPLPSSEHVTAVKSCLAIDIGNTFLAEMFSVLVAAETVALAVDTLDALLLMALSKSTSSVSESSAWRGLVKQRGARTERGVWSTVSLEGCSAGVFDTRERVLTPWHKVSEDNSSDTGVRSAFSGPCSDHVACPFSARGRRSGLGGVSDTCWLCRLSGEDIKAVLDCGTLYSIHEFWEASTNESPEICSCGLKLLSITQDDTGLILIACPLFNREFPSKLRGPSWRGTFLISKLKLRSSLLSVCSLGSFFPECSVDLL